MKKSSKILLAVVVVIAVLAVIYRAVNIAPPAELAGNEQLLRILEDGGCAECHSADPKLPFYAGWPVAKSLIGKHIEDGYAVFDIVPFEDALRNGTAPSEVDLAKVERSLSDGSMPVLSHTLGLIRHACQGSSGNCSCQGSACRVLSESACRTGICGRACTSCP